MLKKIVFLHGFTQRGAIWRPIVDLLPPGTQIETPDLPGHGDTKMNADETFWNTADTLAETQGPAHWVGYSLGARILLHLAIAHPEVVQSMTVVGAKAGFSDSSEAKARIAADETIADRLEAMTSTEEMRDWLENTWLATPMFASLPSQNRQVQLRLTNNREQLAMSLRQHGSGVQEPLLSRLAEIDIPTTVLWGERDSPLIIKDCQSLASTIPNAESKEVANVGHSIPWEAPELFARIVQRTVNA